MYLWNRTYFITKKVFQSKSAEIGLLSDIRRMNVGMTRARRKLLLVGDSSTLCRQPFFVELLAYVKGVGSYRKALAVQASLGQLICTLRLLAKQSRKYKLIRL
jgi:superfamily I DNA and/or RNA helicase